MKRFSSIASALALFVLPAAAHAAVQINSFTFDPGNKTGKLHFTDPATPAGLVGIGRFKLTGTDGMTAVEYLTYCIDILHYLHAGPFTVSPLSTLVADATKRKQLNLLLGNAPAVTGANAVNVSAAIQLAIWEITYESGNAAYDVTNGAFSVTDGNSGAARTLANQYLGHLFDNSWQLLPDKSAQLLYSANNQSQIFLGVPEPATWTMMIFGFGAIGAAIRRKAARILAVAA